jgi:hypothetical protein
MGNRFAEMEQLLRRMRWWWSNERSLRLYTIYKDMRHVFDIPVLDEVRLGQAEFYRKSHILDSCSPNQLIK